MEYNAANVEEINLRNGILARMQGWVALRNSSTGKFRTLYARLLGEVLSFHSSGKEEDEANVVENIDLRNAELICSPGFQGKAKCISIRTVQTPHTVWDCEFCTEEEKNCWSGALENSLKRDFYKFYTVGHQVEKDSFSSLYKAYDIWNTDLEFTVRIIDMHRRPKHQRLQLRRELFAYSVLNHKHIVKTVDLFLSVNQAFVVFERIHVYGKLSHMLFRFTEKLESVPEPLAKSIIRQVFEALAYLHCKGVVHRDLNPQNIYLSSGNPISIRIGNFGSTNFLSTIKVNDKIHFDNTEVASSEYMALELVLGKDHGTAVDMWSAGVILYQMLFGELPFEEKSSENFHSKVRKGILGLNMENKLSENVHSLIKQLLQSNSEKRICAIGALNHDWFEATVISNVGWSIENHSEGMSGALSVRRNFPLSLSVRNIARRGLQHYETQNKRGLDAILRSQSGKRQLKRIFPYRRKLFVVASAIIAAIRMQSYARGHSITRHMALEGFRGVEGVLKIAESRGSVDKKNKKNICT